MPFEKHFFGYKSWGKYVAKHFSINTPILDYDKVYSIVSLASASWKLRRLWNSWSTITLGHVSRYSYSSAPMTAILFSVVLVFFMALQACGLPVLEVSDFRRGRITVYEHLNDCDSSALESCTRIVPRKHPWEL